VLSLGGFEPDGHLEIGKSIGDGTFFSPKSSQNTGDVRIIGLEMKGFLVVGDSLMKVRAGVFRIFGS